MKIAFLCPSCRHRVETDSHAGGTRVLCPACGKGMIVPRANIGPGVTLGGFRIEKKLGEGGMGEVFLARQLSMDRLVALKVLSGQLCRDQELADRFLAEVKTLALLEHPNIVTAHEAGSDDGILFLAMAYVPGKSLQARLDAGGPLDEEEALKLTRKMAQALAYAWHDHKLLHRDIKPANVLLDAHGEPRLADFGLAKTLEGKEALTLSGSVLGTPNYMSPEQAQGVQDLDFRSDLYSLGATLYHMLTGKIPFGGSSIMETLRKQVSENLPDPRLANPKVSEGCVAVLELMLAKKREQRYGSWEALLEDLDRLLAGQAPTRSRLAEGESVLLRSGAKSASRGKGKLIAALTAVVVLALGVGIAVWAVRKPAVDPAFVPTETGMSATPVVQPVTAVEARAAQEAKAREVEKATMEREAAAKAAREAAAQAEQVRAAAEKAAQAEKEQIAAAQAAQQAAQEAKVREEAAATVARTRLNDALGEVAELLLKPDYAKARERVESLCREPELAPVKTKVEALAAAVGKAIEPDESILESFERDKGDTVKVETKNGAMVEVRIMGVSGSQVQARQMVQGGLIDRAFGPKDLSVRERLQRLGEGDTPETRLQRGLMLGHEGEAWDRAEQEFSAAGTLGEALVTALKAHRAGREDQAAHAALISILKMAKLPEDMDDPGHVIECVAAKPIASADAARFRSLAAAVIEAYPNTDAAKMAQALIAALSGDAETTARIQLVTLLKNVGIEPDLDHPEKMVEAVETRAFGTNAEKVQKEAMAFTKTHGNTETARTFGALITALSFARTEAPAAKSAAPLIEGTAENLNKAILALRADNPKYKGIVITNSLSKDKISLELGEDPNLKNIGALAGFPIVSLSLKGCAVEDLSPLAGMPLTYLSVRSSRLKDTRPLSGLESLKALNLSGCPVSNLQPLRELTRLESLTIECPELTRIDDLAGMRLNSLSIRYSPIEDLTPLAGMPLKNLTMGSFPPLITDLTPLKDCPLQILYIDGTRIKSLIPLAGMTLNRLSIANSAVSDLSPLTGMPLWQVTLENIGTTDLSPLKSDKLMRLYLRNLPVREFKPLEGCSIEALSVVNLPKLTDFDKIPEYFPDLRELQIQEEFSKPSFIARFPKLTRLAMFNAKTGAFKVVPLDTMSTKKGRELDAKPGRR